MKLSWNWLLEWVDLSALRTPAKLAEVLTQRGLEVESIEPLSQGWEFVIVAQILSKNPHPQADRLSVCQVKTGLGEDLQIVCGAKNMKAGDKVALAQVGASLPCGLQIASNSIRGVLSQGMLCSEEELKLKESSEGILILPEEAPLGISLASYLGREDVILSLKVTPNRGDCLSYRGIAQELVAWGLPAQASWRHWEQLKKSGDFAFSPTQRQIESINPSFPIQVRLEAGEEAPQFLGCWLEGVQAKQPSPLWMSRRLEQAGFRSINAIVDATNWILLEWGHPVHVYDAHKIRGQSLSIRFARKGEQLPLLDGKKIELSGQELVVADIERAISLAGVMGGGNSQVEESTRSVFLECALFSAQKVRQASSHHQRKTEAAQRFERGVDPENGEFILWRLATLIQELVGGERVGEMVREEMPSFNSSERKNKRAISLSRVALIHFLGFSKEDPRLSSEKIQQILEGLGCKVVQEKDSIEDWTVFPPSWRLDLKTMPDLAEEVARSIGYDQIPSQLPSPTKLLERENLAPFDLQWKLIQKAKQALVSQGFSETCHFSLMSRSALKPFGFLDVVPIQNPLNEEFEVLIPSLIPGLIQHAEHNRNHHFGSEPFGARLFELRSVFLPLQDSILETKRLSFLMTGPVFAQGLRAKRGETGFYELKACLENLLQELKVSGTIRFSSEKLVEPHAFPFLHPGQSTFLWVRNQKVGFCGMLHPQLFKKSKLSSTPVGLVELDWDGLQKSLAHPARFPSFRPWSLFPGMERDFALWVPDQVSCEALCQTAMKGGKPLAQQASVFDLYQEGNRREGMTRVGVRVIFYREGRSLVEEEVEEASQHILGLWKSALGVELRV